MSRLRHAIAAASAGSSGLVAGSAGEDDGDESFSSQDATGSDSDLGSGKTRGLRQRKAARRSAAAVADWRERGGDADTDDVEGGHSLPSQLVRRGKCQVRHTTANGMDATFLGESALPRGGREIRVAGTAFEVSLPHMLERYLQIGIQSGEHKRSAERALEKLLSTIAAAAQSEHRLSWATRLAVLRGAILTAWKTPWA